MLGSLVDTLSPTTMAKLLSTFAIAPVAPAPPTTSPPPVDPNQTPPPQTPDSVAADRQMAVDLAAIDAAVARVDDRAKVLSPSSRAAARASLLCAEEVTTTHDAQARSDNFNALNRTKAMQPQVAAIRLRQTQVIEAQRLVDLKLAQATAACDSASDDADRIAKAGAVRRAAHLDEVRLRREVVARLPAVSFNIVTSGNDGGAVGTAPRRGATAHGGGSVAVAKEVHCSRVDPPLPPGVPASFAQYPVSYHPDVAYYFADRARARVQ